VGAGEPAAGQQHGDQQAHADQHGPVQGADRGRDRHRSQRGDQPEVNKVKYSTMPMRLPAAMSLNPI
jgi:hypothetical protein